jgi:peptide/nickel transport system permease protein
VTAIPVSTDALAMPSARRRFRRPPWLNGPAIIGLTLIVEWAVVALTVPLWSPHDPLVPIGRRLMGPGRGPLLGTDALGRDGFSRAEWGTRTT